MLFALISIFSKIGIFGMAGGTGGTASCCRVQHTSDLDSALSKTPGQIFLYINSKFLKIGILGTVGIRQQHGKIFYTLAHIRFGFSTIKNPRVNICCSLISIFQKLAFLAQLACSGTARCFIVQRTSDLNSAPLKTPE